MTSALPFCIRSRLMVSVLCGLLEPILRTRIRFPPSHVLLRSFARVRFAGEFVGWKKAFGTSSTLLSALPHIGSRAMRVRIPDELQIGSSFIGHEVCRP